MIRYRPPQLPRIELQADSEVGQYLKTDADVLERELANEENADLVKRFYKLPAVQRQFFEAIAAADLANYPARA